MFRRRKKKPVVKVMDYQFYYQGNYYTVQANTVELAFEALARLGYSAKMRRECTLVNVSQHTGPIEVH